jgi:hypothetical protein
MSVEIVYAVAQRSAIYISALQAFEFTLQMCSPFPEYRKFQALQKRSKVLMMCI